MSKKTINVYDTITGQIVEVEVSQEVYEEYKRAGWREEKNNSSFFKHEIQFSILIGGKDGAFENFHEFISDSDPTTKAVIEKILIKEVLTALEKLKTSDRRLIEMIYFDNLTERECAKELETTQQNIHKRKERILYKIHKLIEFQK